MFKFAFIWLFTASLLPAAELTAIRGIWLGQDGSDFCQTSSSLGPNDIQDLHIRLENVPADDEIQSILIRRNGGGEWAINVKSRSWKGHLIRSPHATTADIYLEPSHNEPICRLDFELQMQRLGVSRFSVAGGRSNPNLFMPTAQIKADWIGQEASDWTGPGPAVGPDGLVDARIDLAGVSTNLEINSILVEGTKGLDWEYGLNPSRRANAEFFREKSNRSRGSLFFSPDRNLEGEKLTVRITYKIDRSNATEVMAGKTEPAKAMPKPTPIAVTPANLKINWLGQDGTEVTGSGDVHLTMSEIAAGRNIAAAALSDPAGACWVYRADKNAAFYPLPDNSLPITLRSVTGSNLTDIFFQPYRDESNTPMTLRLLLDNGQTLVQQFRGGACDPFLRGPMPAKETVEAKPGDDLNQLAEKAGAIRLTPGRYVTDHPLKLSRPITITGTKESVVFFTQKADEPAWSGAVLLGASHITLRGFSIRFAENFRWDIQGRSGVGLLRTYDKPGNPDPKCGIALENLDIESSSVPAPTDPAKPIEAPYLTRLAGATSGRITGNIFRGGTVDVGNGPWLITGNEHRGTVPGTVSYDAFGAHWAHDLTLQGNLVLATEPAGKMWRFFTVNQLGYHMLIQSNTVSGVGMRDTDVIPNPNAPEILLTESYRLYFEGKPSAISDDGRVLQIPVLMQSNVRPGSLVSILDGLHAGEYFTIAQPLSPTAFLMTEALPPGDYAISVAHGFVDGVIAHNRIDVRGGRSAVIVLAGNHWNFAVENNHLLGGGDSLIAQATPTEDPFIWGWSHNPFLVFSWKNNIHEDSLRGVSIDVDSNRYTKSTRGRTYMTGTCANNIIRMTDWISGNTNRRPESIRIGSHTTGEQAQMKLTVSGNTFENKSGKPAEARLSIRDAIVNGRPMATNSVELPQR